MKIGTIKTYKKPRIALKNYVKDHWQEGKQIELPIIRIFPPARFPNFTLICIDKEKNIEISKTLSETVGKELLKQFNFSIKRETPGTLYLFIKHNGDLEIERVPEKNKVYVFTGNSFVLVNQNENQQKIKEIDDDLPF